MYQNSIQNTNSVVRFLKKGKFFKGLRLKDKTSKMYKNFGTPKAIIGDNSFGFYEFSNGVRIGYIDDYLDELAILFDKRNVKYPIEITSSEKEISLSKYVNEISNKTRIHEFLRVLGYNNIKWKSCDERSKECLSIVTEANVLITFTLEDGKLFRIVYSDISIALGNRAFSAFVGM